MEGTKRRWWRSLEALVVLAFAALVGCQAVGPPQPSISAVGRSRFSIMDECANPGPSNTDWCLSTQYPNAN